MNRLGTIDALLLAVAAGGAYALKRFYASAGADELAWVLRPTAWLVTLASGHAFELERGAGPFNRELGLVIAPSCAGLHFAIAAFLSLTVGFVPRLRTRAAKVAWLLAAAPIVYAATLVVNAARIALTIGLRDLAHWAEAPSHATVHRVQGCVVYFGALLVLWALTGRVLLRGSAAGRGALVLPALAYLSLTLLIPALNGAAARPAFWGHAAVVSTVTATCLALAALGRWRRVIR